MALDPCHVIGWARAGTLLAGMAAAAWMDLQARRVPNRHWLIWSQPVILLWLLDLIVREADWTVLLTMLLPLCLASGAVVGRPSLADLRAGSLPDVVATLAYVLAGVGLVAGASRHASVEPLDLLLWSMPVAQALWWELVGVTLLIALIDMAWRLRLLHGGADAKALMWVAMLIPTWGALPWLSDEGGFVLHLPPALAILLWGGLAFLLMPPFNLVRNLVRGDLARLGDLRLALHAERMDRAKVVEAHVWLLSDVEHDLDGTMRLVHRTRAPRHTPSKEAVSERLALLESMGEARPWVTQKIPLLVVLLPACLAGLTLGDVSQWLFAWLV
jgi:hypothetical protein